MKAPDMKAPDATAADTTAPDATAADTTAQQPGSVRDEHACAQAWAALTAAHALVTGQLGDALTRTCGLSINEFQILLRADRAPEAGVRLGELRSAVRLTQPSLSRAVARLERHGWLRRAGAPGDGRGVLVSVTASGREVLAQGSAVHTQTISELLLDRLTPDEQDSLARALTRVAEGGHSPTVQEHSWHSQPHSA
jgi:DNA-binding MarR family transcriptional regulator